MERKIGEIFKYIDKWYQCLEEETCTCFGCDFRGYKCDSINLQKIKGSCMPGRREDNKPVIFKKLEKVGEPYSDYCPTSRIIYFQRYRCYQKPIIEGNIVWNWPDDDFIDIEIKQNKESMEEKKLNLKPFDLQKAREGKPVYTRDGRKARIICFDAEGNKPLIVLSKIDGKEVILRYTEKGQSDNFHSPTPREDDLMMLPEKKEGWVAVYPKGYLGNRAYPTKEDAIKSATDDVVGITKITWEE